MDLNAKKLDEVLSWPMRDADPDVFAEAVEGCRIIGAEPVGLPNMESVILYLTDRAGEVFAVEIGSNMMEVDSLDDVKLYTRIAYKPPEAHRAAQGGGPDK